MNNFIPPKKIMGIVKITPKDWWADYYYIGEAKLSIEKIGNCNFLNIWANAFHYLLHNGKKVLVLDLGFEIMQPIAKDIKNKEIIQIESPTQISEMENSWEDVYFSNFYQREHLRITNWSVSLTPFNDTYKIEIKGFITDDIHKMNENHFFESTLEAKMETKINSRWNWKYALNNPRAINKNKK